MRPAEEFVVGLIWIVVGFMVAFVPVTSTAHVGNFVGSVVLDPSQVEVRAADSITPMVPVAGAASSLDASGGQLRMEGNNSHE